MASKSPRINVTIDPAVAELLSSIANHNHVSISNLAAELIWEALELREDVALSTLADIRDSNVADTVSHDNAWK